MILVIFSKFLRPTVSLNIYLKLFRHSLFLQFTDRKNYSYLPLDKKTRIFKGVHHFFQEKSDQILFCFFVTTLNVIYFKICHFSCKVSAEIYEALGLKYL